MCIIHGHKWNSDSFSHLQMDGQPMALLVVPLHPPAGDWNLSAGAGGAPPPTCKWIKTFCRCWWCTSSQLQMDGQPMALLVVPLHPPAGDWNLSAAAGGAPPPTCKWMASQWHCWWGHCIHLQVTGTSVQLLVVHLHPPANGSKLSAGAGGAPPATCKWMASQWHCWWCHCIHLQVTGTSVQVLVVHLHPPANGWPANGTAGGAIASTCR